VAKEILQHIEQIEQRIARLDQHLLDASHRLRGAGRQARGHPGPVTPTRSSTSPPIRCRVWSFPPRPGLYRHLYRQIATHQHWRGFPGGFAKTHLSRSIEIYRFLSTPRALCCILPCASDEHARCRSGPGCLLKPAMQSHESRPSRRGRLEDADPR
jgi:hypothetical protein